MSIIDDLQNSVDSAWKDITTTGVPAVIAGAENYAADQLKGQAQQNQAQAQAAVQAAVQSQGAATGIGASINQVMSQIAQGTVFKQYGLYIIAGVLVVMIAGRRIL